MNVRAMALLLVIAVPCMVGSRAAAAVPRQRPDVRAAAVTPKEMRLPAAAFSPGAIVDSTPADNTYADESPFGNRRHPYQYRSIGRTTGYYQRAGAIAPAGTQSFPAYIIYLASIFPDAATARRGYRSIRKLDVEPVSGLSIATRSCPSGSLSGRCTVFDGTPVTAAGSDSQYWIFQFETCVAEAEGYTKHPAWAANRTQILNTLRTVVDTARNQMYRACSPSKAPPPPARFSFTFDSLVVRNVQGVVKNSFHVNQTLTLVATYTAHNLQGTYIAATIRRAYQVPSHGRFQTVSTNSDSIVMVNGPNPADRHSFTPQVTGPWRIIVDITAGGVRRQRRVTFQITR